MAKIRLSKEAAMKAIAFSKEAHNQLMLNINVMDNNVNSQFSGLQDPAFKRYLEMSGRMQEMLKQIGGKIDEISKYCESVVLWIDSYSEV